LFTSRCFQLWKQNRILTCLRLCNSISLFFVVLAQKSSYRYIFPLK
jgi:hypothetical protein